MMDANAAVLAGLILRVKAQIVTDALDGVFGEEALAASKVRSFSDLHDYTDANCYGGLCDDGPAAAPYGGCNTMGFLGSLVRGPATNDPEADAQRAWDEACDQFVNPMQDAVDAWIKADGIMRVLADVTANHVDVACVRAMALGIPADTGAEFTEAFL